MTGIRFRSWWWKTNLSLAELFKRKMMSIGRQVETPALGDIGLLATTLKKEDCAIVISYSGNNMAHTTMGIHKIEQGVLLETPRWINSEETEVKG